ncbi:MAG: ribosome small subunit-dependent GTPase A [Firmicutes bacterium]|nr:ribosome small subunit-dependent GTPase A [Bacillota bacterium]
MLKGRIIKNVSNDYTVLSNKELYVCKPRGKFRELGLTPLVGDIVEFDDENNYILNIFDRINELDRPSISNVDVALIITSLKKPDLSLNLLDKEISSIILSNIEPVICFTKLDLVNKEEIKELKKLIKYYENIGIKVFTNNKLKKLVKYLKGKYVVLTGQTGAGKSSLINLLDPKKDLKVGGISEALGRGKHTTRHTEFYEVKNIFFADTPGFSSLDLSKYSNEEIRDSFFEFKNGNCEFKNCMHIKEVNCEVKEKLEKNKILKSRYENYINFIK